MKRSLFLLSIALGVCCVLVTCSMCVSAAPAKRLNNLVVELANITGLGGTGGNSFSYTNPYDGWIFFSVKYPDGKTEESMKFMAKGAQVFTAAQNPDKVIIRAIPELNFCKYLSTSIINGYGVYDKSFLDSYISKNTNCITISNGTLTVNPNDLKAWRAQGKRVIVLAGIPTKSAVEADESINAYNTWYKHPGYQHELADGIIVDELESDRDADKYGAWSDVITKIYSDPQMKDKVFYAWVSSKPVYDNAAGVGFLNTIYSHSGKVALEHYIPEAKTPADADNSFNKMRNAVAGWKSSDQQGNRNVILTLGYMSEPNHSLNIYPDVDFKVYMDQMMNVVANNFQFYNLYGLIWYHSHYADEETVRWASRLFRHYCIEGNKGMLSDKYGYRYHLDYIKNPDFENGTDGWNVDEAENGSILATTQDAWSFLQGRYPRTKIGNTCIVTKRSASKPNIIRQDIKNLVPGKLYSLKMLSGDRQALINNISDQTAIKMAVKIDNADILASKSFDEMTTSHPTHIFGKFDSKNPYWFMYHWRVFRATSETAKLTITDWASDEEPGGPVGQELMHNFVEVQPYFSE